MQRLLPARRAPERLKRVEEKIPSDYEWIEVTEPLIRGPKVPTAETQANMSFEKLMKAECIEATVVVSQSSMQYTVCNIVQ